MYVNEGFRSVTVKTTKTPFWDLLHVYRIMQIKTARLAKIMMHDG